MTFSRLLPFFFAIVCYLSVNLQAAEPTHSTVWLGFSTVSLEGLPNAKEVASFMQRPAVDRSAFLLQLRRQAILLAARDELGAITRDAFLNETAPENAVRIPDVAQFPNSQSEYTNHQQFLIEVEKFSRNEFVTEWKSLGLEQAKPSPQDNADLEAVCKEIDTLLGTWALIPQFEAVRRTHEAIQQHGESFPLLKRLVRGYTQLQILTNNAPRDTHRVFQARAMLYAQRVVAKYGEKPDTHSLRATAWSLNNFLRLAREDFAAIPAVDLENAEPWIKLAQLYAEFDIKGLAATIDNAEFATEKGLASLLYFMALDYAREGLALARPFGESAIIHLPDCARFYQGVFGTRVFNMVYAPDGSPFDQHLARRTVSLLQGMRGIPKEANDTIHVLSRMVHPPAGNLLGWLSGRQTATSDFSMPTFHLDLAKVLKALSETTPANDPVEPSLQVLATLIQDEQFQTVRLVSSMYTRRNGDAAGVVEPAKPVIEDHPAFDFLVLTYRDTVIRDTFRRHLLEKDTKIPYNLFSQACRGMVELWHSTETQTVYAPYYAAGFFADMENIRDATYYHDQASRILGAAQPYFIIDVLQQLAPTSPNTVAVRVKRSNTISLEGMEEIQQTFGTYSGVAKELAWYYERRGQTDRWIEALRTAYDVEPTYAIMTRLIAAYLSNDEPDKAIEVARTFLESPEAETGLSNARATQSIGRILFQQGKFEEAEPYFVHTARTGSAWGLRQMGQYYEVLGRFDDAERMYRALWQSYPDVGSGLFTLWAFYYSTNHPKFDETTAAIFERFNRFRTGDSATRAANRTRSPYILYPCYCLDLPYPEELGDNSLGTEFLRSGDGIMGFLVWLEYMEKNDREKADLILYRLRDLWALREHADPFAAAQQRLNPPPSTRNAVPMPFRQIAAMIEADQRTDNPGNLDSAEVHFLLQRLLPDSFNTGDAQLLYILGRYHALHGQTEKANDYYRRVLAVRSNFDHALRCLTVKELRKSGMNTGAYIEYSQGDAQFPSFKHSTNVADVLVRQHFRVYTESPSATLLAMPAAAEPVAVTDFGEITAWNPGWYKVTKALFRGNAVPENDLVVYWQYFGERTPNARTHGIAHGGPLLQQVSSRQPDGTYPLQIGNFDTVSASLSFHGNNLALTVWIKPDEDPVRIEMKKLEND